jgi:hypothetical protein
VHIVRRAAYQGHAVPATAGYARNPFDPAVIAPPVIVLPEPEPEAPYGATAQNNYAGEPLFRCTLCDEIVPESLLDEHRCPDAE